MPFNSFNLLHLCFFWLNIAGAAKAYSKTKYTENKQIPRAAVAGMFTYFLLSCGEENETPDLVLP